MKWSEGVAEPETGVTIYRVEMDGQSVVVRVSDEAAEDHDEPDIRAAAEAMVRRSLSDGSVSQDILVRSSDVSSVQEEGAPPEWAVPGYDLIGDPIGEGGYGLVFRARPKAGGPDRAVKLLVTPATSELDDAEQRFLREVDALYKIDHECVVKFVESGFTTEGKKVPFIVTELVEGETLIKGTSALPHQERIRLFVDLLGGLSASHEQGVLHRDFRPANAMIRAENGRPVLIDFGASYVLHGLSPQTLTTYGIGTAGYVPEEVSADPTYRAVTHDVYSAAVTLYELLAGRRPVRGNYQQLANIDPSLAGLDRVVFKGLDAEQNRYQSIQAMATDLRAWLAGQEALADLQTGDVLTRIRDGLRERESERLERVGREQARSELITAAWTEWDARIVSVADRPFEQLHALLSAELGPVYDLRRHRIAGAESTDDDKPAPVFELVNKGNNIRVVFARLRGLGRSFGRTGASSSLFSVKGALPLVPGRGGRQRASRPEGPVKVVRPFWVVYREGSSSPPRILSGGLGLIITAEEPLQRVFEVALHAIPLNMPSGAPDALESPAEIADYILRAAAKNFSLNV